MIGFRSSLKPAFMGFFSDIGSAITDTFTDAFGGDNPFRTVGDYLSGEMGAEISAKYTQENMRLQGEINERLQNIAFNQSLSGQSKQYEYNKALQELAQKFNKSEAEIARKFEKSMSDTSYQRAVKDLRKANLNPLLAVTGMSGASTPSGQAATSTPASVGGVSGSPASVSGGSVSAGPGGLGQIASIIGTAMSAYSGLSMLSSNIASNKASALKDTALAAEAQSASQLNDAKRAEIVKDMPYGRGKTGDVSKTVDQWTDRAKGLINKVQNSIFSDETRAVEATSEKSARDLKEMTERSKKVIDNTHLAPSKKVLPGKDWKTKAQQFNRLFFPGVH